MLHIYIREGKKEEKKKLCETHMLILSWKNFLFIYFFF